MARNSLFEVRIWVSGMFMLLLLLIEKWSFKVLFVLLTLSTNAMKWQITYFNATSLTSSDCSAYSLHAYLKKLMLRNCISDQYEIKQLLRGNINFYCTINLINVRHKVLKIWQKSTNFLIRPRMFVNEILFYWSSTYKMQQSSYTFHYLTYSYK